jgi:hypothetical protein
VLLIVPTYYFMLRHKKYYLMLFLVIILLPFPSIVLPVFQGFFIIMAEFTPWLAMFIVWVLFLKEIRKLELQPAAISDAAHIISDSKENT